MNNTPAANPVLDLAVIGGGAAGFFVAIQFAERNPGKSVTIFEKGQHCLQKVRISGGGRCNVTHACFDPKLLAKHYPRGERELRGAFHHWQPTDMVEWLKSRGVKLKTEADGRMFPITDSSETIIDCFHHEARKLGVTIKKNHLLTDVQRVGETDYFDLEFGAGSEVVRASRVCIATGSLKSSPLLRAFERLGHPIVPLVPSLFAFNVNDRRISGLAGVSHPAVAVWRADRRKAQTGPILITHRGLSGPAILRMSAWDAVKLAAAKHHFPFYIDWLPEYSESTLRNAFAERRKNEGAKTVRLHPITPIPKRLWERLTAEAGCDDHTTWGQLPRTVQDQLITQLKTSPFEAMGKTTNKDEFVSAGGIQRSSIYFNTMESKTVPGLFFAGECIDLDGITGGFNFQAAWTTAHLAAQAM